MTVPSAARRLLAGAAVVLLGLAGAAAARADAPLVHLDVIDRDSGEALHVWRDHGRPVIAGRPGAGYALRLVNDSGERVLAVVAVDGVNVVSGETAAAGQRGYVLAPWQRLDVTGWRKSEEEVAAFEFTALADSYAARTGRPRDVGVIGVAVFREAAAPQVTQTTSTARAVLASPPAPAPVAPDARRAGPPAADATPGALAQERLGTGHGAREVSVAHVVPFERASATPEQRLEIRYDSLDNLVAAGIVPPPRVAAAPPRAFPADPPPAYVPDPPCR